MSNAIALRLEGDVIAAATGDQRAFARLVDATRNTVASITLAILNDVDMSQDVAQDVYIAVWKDLRKLREPLSFMPWLRQLTRNRAHEALRAHVRRQNRIARPRDEAMLSSYADPRPNALQQVLNAEERESVTRAIEQLPDSAREVVILFYREGESVRQVAELLDLSEDAVKQRLSRARTQLRQNVIAVLERSAPGGAFTAAILSAVALAAPAAASAATLSIGKTAAGSAGKLVGGALVGSLAGLAGGWAGVIFGTRGLLRLARDEEEARGVIAAGAVQLLGTLGFIIAIIISPTPLTTTIAFLTMIGAFYVIHFHWLIRVTARRHAAELVEDPVAAAREHASRKRMSRLGFGLGTLFGGTAVVASWFF
jgi:RNA polymerase sigma factor (sigma-70 family)